MVSRQAEAGDWTGSRVPGPNDRLETTADLAVKLRLAAENQRIIPVHRGAKTMQMFTAPK